MATTTKEITIQRSPDEVWAVVADFGGIAWMPGVESCHVEGDTRVIGMMGIEVHEALLSSDEKARELVYSVVSSPLPIDSHRATITVHPDTAGARVTWECEVTPDEHVEMLGGIYSQGLEALKARLEK